MSEISPNSATTRHIDRRGEGNTAPKPKHTAHTLFGAATSPWSLRTSPVYPPITTVLILALGNLRDAATFFFLEVHRSGH